jgi:hypothetical protein
MKNPDNCDNRESADSRMPSLLRNWTRKSQGTAVKADQLISP